MRIFKAIKRFFAGLADEAEDVIEDVIDDAGDAIEDAAEEAVEWVKDQAAEIVARLKQTEVGTAVANIVQAVSTQALSGSEKREKVVSATIPLILRYGKKNGLEMLGSDLEGVARALVQDTYNDLLDDGLKRIGSPLLALLRRVF